MSALLSAGNVVGVTMFWIFDTIERARYSIIMYSVISAFDPSWAPLAVMLLIFDSSLVSRLPFIVGSISWTIIQALLAVATAIKALCIAAILMAAATAWFISAFIFKTIALLMICCIIRILSAFGVVPTAEHEGQASIQVSNAVTCNSHNINTAPAKPSRGIPASTRAELSSASCEATHRSARALKCCCLASQHALTCQAESIVSSAHRVRTLCSSRAGLLNRRHRLRRAVTRRGGRGR